MPADKETPEQLAERQADDDIELVEPEPAPKFGRRDPSRKGLVASAARINLDDRKVIDAIKATRQAWQSTAWDHVDLCPEIGYCVDDDTEILSARGWITHRDLHAGDEVLTLNHATGSAEWQACEAVHRFPALEREMLSVETLSHSSLTTLAHRWPTLHYTRGRDGITRYRPRWTTSAGLNTHDRIVTAAPIADAPTEQKWSDAFVELVAWFWTEGTVRRNAGQTSQRIGITQSEGANPGYVARIRAALTALYGPAVESLRAARTRAPAAWKEYRWPGRDTIEFQLNHNASEPLLTVAPDKCVSTSWLRTLTRAQAELFVSTSIDGDGWRNADSRWISQASIERTRAFEVAAVLAGYTPNTIYSRSLKNWVTSLSRRTTSVIRPPILRRVQHYGMVWCPQTPNRTWLARRRGTVYFTGNSLEFAANLMSKLRLFAAVRPDPEEAPIPVDDEESKVDADTAKIAVETLARLRALQGGQAALIRDASFNADVAGEFYLHGHEDDETGEEDWQIRSVDEVVVVDSKFALRSGAGSKRAVAIPTDDVLTRMWVRHPRFSQLPFSPMRRILTDAEALMLLGQEVVAGSKSRMPNGVFIVPIEESFGPVDPTSTDPDEDPLTREFYENVNAAIANPGSAAAVAPFLIRPSAENADKIRWLDTSRVIDPNLDSRIEARVMRVARGVNLPVEIVTGLMRTTFSNAGFVKQSQYDSHIEPRAITLVDLFTAGYFQPALVEAGVDLATARDIFVWFDPTDLIAKDDQSEKAESAHKDGVISAVARRKYQGYNEADAPTDDERLINAAIEGVRSNAQLAAGVLSKFGLIDVEIPTAQRAITAAATEIPTRVTNDLGKRLSDIDRELRARITAAAEQAMKRALERAGNKLVRKGARDGNGNAKTTSRVASSVPPAQAAQAVGPAMVAALGLTDEQLLEGAFDTLASDFGAWVQVSFDKALTEVERHIGALPVGTRDELAVRVAQSIPAAQDWLKNELFTLAAARLFGNPLAKTVGEVDALSTIPAHIARGALAVAGGANPTVGPGGSLADALGQPVLGVATGPYVTTAGQAAGGLVEAYQWEYGPAIREHEFEPHKNLDGYVFENWNDPRLRVVGGFPRGGLLAPGDHKGCVCSAVPVWVVNEQVVPVVAQASNERTV